MKEAEGTDREQAVAENLIHYARDHARTPMQWNSGKNAGFTNGKPWMKINDNYTEINAENQLEDENSVYNFYKKVLSIRKQYADIISKGEFIPVGEENKEVFAFMRKLDDKKLLVVCSFSPNETVLEIEEDFDNAKLVLTNSKDVEKLSNSITLPACTCAVWEI
ncbi:MAG: alpha-glucosidase C-terminal domain-containing protein, partial [Eubacterium sp.]|nr:alpha-glucosidase C-terminal domain-containing protein [Eubacterium sp.]